MAKNDKVFVDSSFLIALFNPPDTFHPKAVAISRKTIKERPQLYISNFVFLETVTVLSQRVNRKTAVVLGQHLLKDQQAKIIHVNQKLNTLAWEIFKEIKKKNVSFIDCSTLAIMKVEGIKKLLTFDQKDFAPLRQKHRFSFYP